jgi:AraC-like DNA-binding protein
MSKTPKYHTTPLGLQKLSLQPGSEWNPSQSGWSLIQIYNGSGYWLESQSSMELAIGTVLLVASPSTGHVRASLLNGLSLYYFNVIPARLTGLISLGELERFNKAANRGTFAFQIIQPNGPVAVKMAEVCASLDYGSLSIRLKLLQLVVDMLGKELDAPNPVGDMVLNDARERLRKFLAETPPDALLEISFDEIAQSAGCTSRHLSRIFCELVGMSFRDKRSEIRLARARELLANSQTKVVEVALESGYKSLSFFNLMFTRRFGVSPGKWRHKHGIVKVKGVTLKKQLRKPNMKKSVVMLPERYPIR